MSQEILIDRMFDALINGDRADARAILGGVFDQGAPAERVITDLFWPVYERVETFHRNDQLSTLAHHLATRLLRVLLDQTAARLTRSDSIGRSVFAVCGPNDADELAAQMAVDILDADGFDIAFAGGGIAVDEILARVHETHPDHLLIFASSPRDLPEIRSLIDTLNEIGACASGRGAGVSPVAGSGCAGVGADFEKGRTQIVVGGGVFNRADGLAEEIGADLWASDPASLVHTMRTDHARRAEPDQRTVGKARAANARRAVA